MKKILSLLLTLCLLLTGCQTAAPEETEKSVTYDWRAGESPIPQQRTGLSRQGIPNSSMFETTADGVYFTYRTISDGITWLLYGDNGGNSIIKLCGRADCSHSDRDCNAYLDSANCIGFYEGYLYVATGGAGAPRLVRMNPNGTDRVTVMNSTSTLAEYGYSGSALHSISDGVYTFIKTKIDEEGTTIGDGWYYKLDGSMEEPAPFEGGVPFFSGGGQLLCYTNSPNGCEYGGYEAWDPETNTATYLTDHSGYAGYYGTEEAYYFRDGTVWRLDYATQQETVLFETGLTGDYSAKFYPDCIMIAPDDVEDQNLYFYNWAFELVDTVALDYPSRVSPEMAIVGENEERIILTYYPTELPRYYIEKSELGTGNAVVHEYKLPDFSEEVQFIEEQISDAEWSDSN